MGRPVIAFHAAIAVKPKASQKYYCSTPLVRTHSSFPVVLKHTNSALVDGNSPAGSCHSQSLHKFNMDSSIAQRSALNNARATIVPGHYHAELHEAPPQRTNKQSSGRDPPSLSFFLFFSPSQNSTLAATPFPADAPACGVKEMIKAHPWATP